MQNRSKHIRRCMVRTSANYNDSRKIGYYDSSYNAKHCLQPTGSREVCGFFDLGNAWKFIAKDPWDEIGGFCITGGDYSDDSRCYSVANQIHYFDVTYKYSDGVGVLALD